MSGRRAGCRHPAQRLDDLLAAKRIALKPKTVRVEGLTAEFGDGTTVESDNIVWATGFRFDYGWLRIPGALNEGGRPLHERGASPVGGLHYVGLPWQTSRNSDRRCRKGRGGDGEGDFRRTFRALLTRH
jgi:putative flavoprotein involved in K+ transport